MATVEVSNETTSQSTRFTKEGRKITYVMNVIQQPERARACGSGAKSSADRRPVDPPPIVELRVYEGEGTANDITFSYSANFFLFATLENARTMAQTRNSAGPASFPVLTGTPVAGMAYLDRPKPAGYFIFPDLSVRHEGRYRLSFALFEELKDQKDMDAEPMTTPGAVSNSPLGAHVSHRLEVKSTPFIVFSAKKFPGLTESTALSRLVAEQGCRVRIRRDVRMRRRENKPAKEWSDFEEEAAYDRARRTATPDSYAQQQISTPQGLITDPERPRSVSNASNASFSMPPQRRPSIQDMAQSYQQGYQTQMQAPVQHGGYSPMPYAAPQPAQQYPPQYAAQQQPMMHPPQTPYAAPHPGYQSQPPMQVNQNYGYMQHSQPYTHQPYEQPAPRHDEYVIGHQDYNRHAPPPQAHSASYHAPAQMPVSYPMEYKRAGQTQAQPVSHTILAQQQHMQATSPPQPANGHPLAPLKALQPLPEKHEPVSPSYGTSGPIAASETMSNGALPKYSTAPPPPAGTKRSFSSTFGHAHADQPLRQGARPASPNGQDFNGGPYDGSDGEDFVPDKDSMSYRRADGTQRSRRIPFST